MTFNDLKFESLAGMGEQAQVTFPNGYGASVVRGRYTYGGSAGLYELAVRGPDGRLDYTTPVTDDVLGHLTPAAVTEALGQIAALPAKKEKP
ncbi:MAG TPA: hypothetical protein VM531_09045 [Sphingomicrobium sp.]|jgi:hypothetical protein|nr:hypothetical protein [Sphingomicrobium sp.]